MVMKKSKLLKEKEKELNFSWVSSTQKCFLRKSTWFNNKREKREKGKKKTFFYLFAWLWPQKSKTKREREWKVMENFENEKQNSHERV